MFTQSPIEAAIWSSFVSVQDWVVQNFLATVTFKAAVFTWLGFLFIKAIYAMSTYAKPDQALSRFLVTLVISAFGFSFLAISPAEFKPLNANAEAWSSAGRVSVASGINRASKTNSNGLVVYKIVHSATNQLATSMSSQIAQLFSDNYYNHSPYLFLATMAKTAVSTIDDPKAISELNWLFENCSDNKTAPILGTTSSYSALFNLSKASCKTRYNTLMVSLKAWADSRWVKSLYDIGDVGTQYVSHKLGFGDGETLKNKIIASAMVNTARLKMGTASPDTTNAAALLDKSQANDFLGSSTSFFVGLGNSLSLGGFFHRLLSPFTGGDIYGADARNQSAFLYNRIIQFLPPIRGYAKGIIALAFVFAAASMCFGSLKYIIAWFGMLFIFTLYEPASTLLYEITMQFSSSGQVLESMQALKNDPFILSGAAIIDDSLARIQAVYFVLQLGLTITCAAGGLSVFFLARRIGGGLSENLVGKLSGLMRIAHIAR